MFRPTAAHSEQEFALAKVGLLDGRELCSRSRVLSIASRSKKAAKRLGRDRDVGDLGSGIEQQFADQQLPVMPVERQVTRDLAHQRLIGAGVEPFGKGASGRRDFGAQRPARVEAPQPPAGGQGGTHSVREQVRIQKHIINRHTYGKLAYRICPWSFIRFAAQ
jgi:hypothetical protein